MTNNIDTEINTTDKIIDYILSNPGNYFIHGKAGTGKTTFIKKFVQANKKTLILATTGIAAINAGGVTLHSFFGIGPNSISFAEYHPNFQLFKKAEYIIIDEVSMLRADLLDRLDNHLRQLFKEDSFFAGKNVIFVGDLYQLPPVVTSDEKEYFFNNYETEYFFGYPEVFNANIKLIELTKVRRQKDDKDFLSILNRIREAKHTKQDLWTLNKKVSNSKPEGTIYLASTNKVVKEINDTFLENNPNGPLIAIAEIKGKVSEKYYPIDEFLVFKKDAQVMSVINHPENYFIRNGTRGIIKEINEKNNEIIVDFFVEDPATGQELTITESIKPWTWEIREPELDENNNIKYKKVGTFKQFPLKIAYAITIHKSQGLTFDKIYVDLGKFAFAKHMVYVALSRVTSMNGLHLKRPIYYKEIKTDELISLFLKQMDKIKI